MDSGGGAVSDTAGARHLWNYYHRKSRALYRNDSGSHTYATQTWRQFDADTNNQFTAVIGVDEDTIDVTIATVGQNGTTAGWWSIGIGLDSTTATIAASVQGGGVAQVASRETQTIAKWTGHVGVGLHTITWLEIVQAGTTGTFYSDDTAREGRSGMIGRIEG